MKTIIVVLFAGMAGALAAQTVPPIPKPPVPMSPVPRPDMPTVPTPQPTSAPMVPVPPSATQAIQMPQGAAVGQVFEGTWSATGRRQTLSTQAGLPAVTVQLSGSLTVRTPAQLSRGFRGEVIGFDDGSGLIVGRVVWTDESGDRIYSALSGDSLTSDGRPMFGTITGGTGRYTGFTGEYEFRWQHVITSEGSSISGRAVDMRGRVRPMGSGQ